MIWSILGAMDRVGPALEALRKKTGVEPGEMLVRLGLKHYSSLARFEGENANPQAKNLTRYLDAIGATPHDLARALDEINGRTPSAETLAAKGEKPTRRYVRAAFPGAPDVLIERYIRAWHDAQGVLAVLEDIETQLSESA